MFKKFTFARDSRIVPETVTHSDGSQSSVIWLGSATALTLGKPGKKNKDGKYFYTK
ncbi:MAG TPA: hypothetical protein VHX59_02920 [Mycobacteriales bacterium]|nr:hypothetical protein [Mycobacteriales bacterium]